MALFNIFKKKEKEKSFGEKQRAKTEAHKKGQIFDATGGSAEPTKEKSNLSSMGNGIIRPQVTEKSVSLNEKGVYVFKIKPYINKIMVKAAVKSSYRVNPVKVRIINTPSKQVFVKRRRAVKAGFKKAIVYLKKGEKINV